MKRSYPGSLPGSQESEENQSKKHLPSTSQENSKMLTLSERELQLLHCSVCNNVLSVGPVLLISDNSNICGRCPSPVEQAMRNYAYEALAAKMKFPCIYENCKLEVPWDQVKSHESFCLYKTTPCLMKNCPWSGSIVKFPAHIQENHKECIFTEIRKYELSLQEDLDLILFSSNFSCKKLLILKLQYNQMTDELTVVPFYLGKIEDIDVEMQLTNREETTSVRKMVSNVLYFANQRNEQTEFVFKKVALVLGDFKAYCNFKLLNK